MQARDLRPTVEAPPASGTLSEALRRLVADLVLETTVEGIWLIDADARTTFVNPRLEALLGYGEDEMLGRPVFDFLDRERWPIAERNLQQRARGIEDRQELQLVRKDGTRVWVLGSANPMFDRDGNYAGALALVANLSPQKERERLLRSEIEALRSRLGALGGGGAGGRGGDRAAERPAYSEPFATLVVLGVMATLTATIGLATVGALAGHLLRPSRDVVQEF
ncbi:MAG TPA: PAS domain S-box protein [Polyangia bacterium]|nr:PAS domain S-box protein [Polyangia bacterium]